MLDLTGFKNPSSKYGIHPFWFWNGEMDEKEIQHQIYEMADKRVTGFFLCARQGMTIPYLSKEWFQKVEFAIETAAQYNIDVWLYDEYPYPSGMAGGEVTLEHPDAKQYQLVHHVEEIEGEEKINFEMPWARILSAKAVPVNQETEELEWEKAVDLKEFIGNTQVEPVYQKTGLTAYNQKRFFTYSPKKVLHWTPPQGQWEIHCFLEQEIEDFKYYGTYVDPCHTEAMASFIRSTHERYAETIGKHFEKTVKGMFTDETHLLGRFPWSPRLIEFIKERYGYDIRDYLHLLISGNEKQAAKVRYQYFQSIHLLLRQSFHKQIHDWCEQNRLDYVAEVPSARMAAQLYSHVPGGDSAHEKLGRSLKWILERYFYSFRANPKMISSLSSQLGRERALIESFHSVGWSMTMQDAKWMIDRLAAFGINFFNFHAFFYTLDGLTKHDAPPSHFLQNPYWKHYKLLGDYTARISYVMSEGTPEHPIAVLDPTTTLWTHMGNPFTAFSYVGADSDEHTRLEQLKQNWSDICINLITSLKDYDHLDPEFLSRAEISNGKIQLGKAAYSVLVLPPLTNLESEAWKTIKRFIEEGGTVIANGILPYEDIEEKAIVEDIRKTFGLTTQSLDNFWKNENKKEFTEEYVRGKQRAFFIPSTVMQPVEQRMKTLLTILDESVEETVVFKVTGGDTTSFLKHHRRLPDSTEVVFLSNQESKVHQASLHIKQKKHSIEVDRLNLESGEKEKLDIEWTGEGGEVRLDFAPYQSHLILINHEPEHVPEEQLPVSHHTARWEIDTADRWKITPLKENMIRFDSFQFCINPEEKIENQRHTVDVKTFIDQCEDLAEKQMLPVEFTQTFGTPMKTELSYPVDVEYLTMFTVEEIPSDCALVMDWHALSGDLEIYINGSKVNKEKFQKEFVYDHNNLVYNIHSSIRKGKNELKVKGKVYHDWDGLLDPLYLKGDFGVEFDSDAFPIMKSTPDTADSLIGPYKGLPYYAGTISFKRKIDLYKVTETKDVILSIPEFEDVHECAELIVNGTSFGVRAWSPYEWQGLAKNLVEGKNEIEVKVTNTLIGLLEGRYFDYQSHSLKDVRMKSNDNN